MNDESLVFGVCLSMCEMLFDEVAGCYERAPGFADRFETGKGFDVEAGEDLGE